MVTFQSHELVLADCFQVPFTGTVLTGCFLMGAVALFMGLCSAAITAFLHLRDELFSGFPIPIACDADVHGIGISGGLRGSWSACVGVVSVI